MPRYDRAVALCTAGAGAIALGIVATLNPVAAQAPDGLRIAFSSNRSDPYQIYVMNADGSGVMQMVNSPYTDVRAQWLPDGRGRGLIFNREHDGRIEILQVRIP